MDFLAVWNRITQETELKKMTQLAVFVSVSQQYVSQKKKENEFPIEWAYKVGRRYNLLTEWILTGEGPKRINDPVKLKRNRLDFLEDFNEWISELVIKEPDRAEWAKHCISDAFPAFREWKRRKESNFIEEGEYPQSKVA